VKSFYICCLGILLILLPVCLLADSNPSQPRSTQSAEPPGDLFPLQVEIFNSPEVLKIDIDQKIPPSQTSLLALPETGPSAALFGANGGGEYQGNRAWPILMSVLVPGAGEIYMGYYVRGIALVAAEVAAWTGYIYYHDKGMDERQDYENFADTHWDYDRWIDWHPDAYPLDLTFEELDSIGRGKWATGGGFPPYHPYFPKEEDKQSYYETIGKYDWFISGWADFDPVAIPHDTDLRTQYRAMRKTSNDDLKTADRFIYLSLGVRAFSIIETILLSRDRDQDIDSGAGGVDGGFELTVRPSGFSKTILAVEYRF
jgi:hypothetical protein